MTMTAQQMASSIALFTGNKVLLIERARQPYKGLWTLPGGKAEPGETAEACAKREVAEELGLVINALVPVVVQQLAGYTLSVFATRTFSGDPHPCDEVAAWRWCRPEDLEDLSTTPGLSDIVGQAARVLSL